MERVSDNRVAIHILTGHVLLGNQPVRLAVREREVLTALGMSAGAVDIETLCEMVYPDRDPSRARNALKVFVHRIRQRLGHDVIVSVLGGYALHHATVDVVACVRRIRECACQIDALSANDLEQLIIDAAALLETLPALYRQWEWFAKMHATVVRLGSDTLQMVAWKLLRQDRAEQALRVARLVIASDPCDEGAREIVIHALAALGRPAAAMTEYQRYTDLLAKELGMQPSFRLREYYHSVLATTTIDRAPAAVR